MAARDPFVGEMLGKFTIERKLGQGGMGAVYQARDNLGRRVALKLLPPHFAAQPEWLERFRREASRAALLDHPNIVAVFEADEAGGHHYISMQFMEGGSLEGLLQRRGALPPAEAASIVRDAARGLARAHQQGVIHRDIKPANILLGQAGEVRLGDFGLVKSVEGDDQPLTRTGMVLGTPHYMAPEQCEGLPDVDGRADLYALGLVLYQALSNTLPVKGSTPLQIIRYRLLEDPPPLATVAPSTPPALVAIVDALLVRDRDQRLSSAADLAARLDAFLAGHAPGHDSDRSLVGGAITAAATLTPLPPFDPPPGAPVPTARLVRYDRPSAPAPDVLPDLEAPAPPVRGSDRRLAPGAPRPPAARADRAPARRHTLGCWIVGCGLLVVGGCLAAGVMAQLHEEQQQLEWETLRRLHQEQLRQEELERERLQGDDGGQEEPLFPGLEDEPQPPPPQPPDKGKPAPGW